MFWPDATCANMYEVNFTPESGSLDQWISTTKDTSFDYDVPSDVDDCYNISVYSLDYFGMRAGSPAYTRVGVRCEYFYFYNDPFFVAPVFLVITDISDDSTILTISIVSYVLCDYA